MKREIIKKEKITFDEIENGNIILIGKYYNAYIKIDDRFCKIELNEKLKQEDLEGLEILGIFEPKKGKPKVVKLLEIGESYED